MQGPWKLKDVTHCPAVERDRLTRLFFFQGLPVTSSGQGVELEEAAGERQTETPL